MTYARYRRQMAFYRRQIALARDGFAGNQHPEAQEAADNVVSATIADILSGNVSDDLTEEFVWDHLLGGMDDEPRSLVVRIITSQDAGDAIEALHELRAAAYPVACKLAETVARDRMLKDEEIS